MFSQASLDLGPFDLELSAHPTCPLRGPSQFWSTTKKITTLFRYSLRWMGIWRTLHPRRMLHLPGTFSVHRELMDECEVLNVRRATQWTLANGLGVIPKVEPHTIGFEVLILRQVLSLCQGTPRGVIVHRCVSPGKPRTWALLFGAECLVYWFTAALRKKEKGRNVFSYWHTVGSKIIRALEIVRVKNSYLMQFYEIKVRQFTIFSLHIVYNKHEMIKIGNQIREKLQALSQVLE